MISNTELPSTRPYLIRALYDWCSDNGFTPYVAVKVDNSVQVPREYVQGGEIVLNVSMDATSSLKLGNDFIQFKARFGGKPREIMVPVERIMAIYARENGQGMAFPVHDHEMVATVLSAVDNAQPPALKDLELDANKPKTALPIEPKRPALKRIK